MFVRPLLSFFIISLLIFESRCRNHPPSKRHYEPTWDSLDSRPLPTWYDEAKIGIFMHLGPYAVPGVGSEWFWWNWKVEDPDGDEALYMKEHRPPGATYQDFGPEFKLEFFDPKRFAQLVAAAGAKYFVFTSKHHDGFANWPSSHNYAWNSMDTGPHRDVVGELKQAFQQVEPKVKFGLYYSLYEWFHPQYLEDKETNFTPRDFVEQKIQPEIKELLELYEPEVLWSDGDWETEEDYWGSQDILAWMYNHSPKKDTIVTNDRWGRGTKMKHGDFYSGADRFQPGHLMSHKWENAMTLDGTSWGHRRNMRVEDVLTVEELLETVVATVSCGGNILINVGPTKDGTIAPLFEERLLQLGAWLKVNGEGIYKSSPWIRQNDSAAGNVWYTSKSDALYAFVPEWPKADVLHLGDLQPARSDSRVSVLGMTQEALEHSYGGEKLLVRFPSMSALLENCKFCQWMWVLKLEGFQAKASLEVMTEDQDEDEEEQEEVKEEQKKGQDGQINVSEDEGKLRQQKRKTLTFSQEVKEAPRRLNSKPAAFKQKKNNIHASSDRPSSAHYGILVFSLLLLGVIAKKTMGRRNVLTKCLR